jgi:hypothetical protein
VIPLVDAGTQAVSAKRNIEKIMKTVLMGTLSSE